MKFFGLAIMIASMAAPAAAYCDGICTSTKVLSFEAIGDGVLECDALQDEGIASIQCLSEPETKCKIINGEIVADTMDFEVSLVIATQLYTGGFEVLTRFTGPPGPVPASPTGEPGFDVSRTWGHCRVSCPFPDD